MYYFIIHCFYIMLFSTLKQTHCALVTCDSEWVTSLFIVHLDIHQSGVLAALFGCYMAGATWNCCHLGTHAVYTIQPCISLQCYFIKATYMGACVFSSNLPPALLAEWLGTLRATVVTRRWNRNRNKSQHWKWRRIFSHRSCWDLNPRPFNHKSDILPLSYPCFISFGPVASLVLLLSYSLQHYIHSVKKLWKHTVHSNYASTAQLIYFKHCNRMWSF